VQAVPDRTRDAAQAAVDVVERLVQAKQREVNANLVTIEAFEQLAS
jgi:hypothetical protein